MSSQTPIATVTRDGKPAAVKSLVLAVFFGAIAVFTGDRIASALGTSTTVAIVAGTVAPTALVVAFAYYNGGRGSVSFYHDRIETKHRSVPYEAVAVAVREGSGGLFGTATFKLFVPGAAPLTLRYVTDPETVSRLLAEHVATPSDQAPAATAPDGPDDGPEYIDDRSAFWTYWRADEALPETAVVSRDDLERVMDVRTVKLTRLDGVNMGAATGLSDIDTDDVTASSTGGGPP